MSERLHDGLSTLQQLISDAAMHASGDVNRDQLFLYELAFATAELTAAEIMLSAAGHAPDNSLLVASADLFAAQTISQTLKRLAEQPAMFGLAGHDVPFQLYEQIEPYLRPEVLIDLGSQFAALGGVAASYGLSEEQLLVQKTFRRFATDVVMPLAEDIHRHDTIVPDEILEPLKQMGCFGLAVPERFGGLKSDEFEDSMGMVIVTEELSRGSLGAAGSLITRPEIMTRALLMGGTEQQQAHWLPRLASGDSLCAISITEPDTGSDVAAVKLKATPVSGGYRLNGAKSWCTFAGKADVLLVLARTDTEAKPPHKGLSLFLVEKPSTNTKSFEVNQQDGGRLTGRAVATLGYRGMHSFDMFYDDFYVPNSALIGEQGGLGNGFYYTMRGFMGGRLQTAARACGLMQAAFEASLRYGADRQIFDKPLADYPLTLAKYARMGTAIEVCRQFAYAVAKQMDAGEGAMESSLVKLFACRQAEWVCREAMQIHGGIGYAEETAVSRYYADARVLSIFEGTEETLAIRVVGKALTRPSRTDAESS